MKLVLSLVSVVLMLAACGKQDGPTLGKQESQRSAMNPELKGTWKSNCEGRQIVTVKIDDTKLNVDRTTFFDTECQDKRQTVKHAGTYKLASNFKEGINNSIVLTPDAQISTTYFMDSDVIAFNNAITKAVNEKEKEIAVGTLPEAAKTLTRENQKTRALRELTPIKVSEEKVMNRLQQEKLADLAVRIAPTAEMSSLVSVRYELDNGFLQMSGPSDLNHVFAKQP